MKVGYIRVVMILRRTILQPCQQISPNERDDGADGGEPGPGDGDVLFCSIARVFFDAEIAEVVNT